jgi:hypothetical protein
MLEIHRANKYEQPYSRPYHKQQVNTNGIVLYPPIQDTQQFQSWGECSMHHAKNT